MSCDINETSKLGGKLGGMFGGLKLPVKNA